MDIILNIQNAVRKKGVKKDNKQTSEIRLIMPIDFNLKRLITKRGKIKKINSKIVMYKRFQPKEQFFRKINKFSKNEKLVPTRLLPARF